MSSHKTGEYREFQSTRPRGARLQPGSYRIRRACFNPRAHVGRDRAAANRLPLRLVSIHAPTWGATSVTVQPLKMGCVSIHAPTWGATSVSFMGKLEIRFNPRAHVGRDSRNGIFLLLITVSIHAPTWGATPLSNCCNLSKSFNPRAHVGRDLGGKSNPINISVSIHAPTWGATAWYASTCVLSCFNPRAHVGRDPHYCASSSNHCCFNPRAHVGRDAERIQLSNNTLFQSTRPRGARHACAMSVKKALSFNPRAHVGRDHVDQWRPRTLEVSIHAPTWGATKPFSFDMYPSVFQSTRPRGARLCRGKFP